MGAQRRDVIRPGEGQARRITLGIGESVARGGLIRPPCPAPRRSDTTPPHYQDALEGFLQIRERGTGLAIGDQRLDFAWRRASCACAVLCQTQMWQ